MKIQYKLTMPMAGLLLSLVAAPGVAATSVLNSTVDALTVAGYSNTGSGSTLQSKALTWYSGDGYGMTSGSDSGSPNHALDNNGAKESLLLNFGASTQLNGVTIGWTGGNDSDITVLAWKPLDYMNAAINPASIAAPDIAGKTYSQLLGLGWMLVGNYGGIQEDVQKTVNGGSQPVSSSYWLVMSYNNLGGGGAAAASNSADATARTFVADSSLDYGKFYSVSYSSGTTTSKVSEPASALLLGMALFGMVGWRQRRLAVLR
ncbi:MAG TPA: exosortase-dependent surface protein XDP1 [Azonexus sp.]